MSERNHLSAYCVSMSHTVHCCMLQISNPIKFLNKQAQPLHWKNFLLNRRVGKKIFERKKKKTLQELLLAASPRRGGNSLGSSPHPGGSALGTTTFAEFHPSERQCLVCVRQFTGSVLHRCWFTQEMAHAA